MTPGAERLLLLLIVLFLLFAFLHSCARLI
jgi:hypothetical protein